MSDPMSPDVSPSTISKKSGVRRINNLPLFIVGGVVLAFILIVVMVAADRNAANQATAAKENKSGGNSNIFADQIVGDRVDGLVMPELSEYEPSATDTATPENIMELEQFRGSFQVARANDFDMPPLPDEVFDDEETQRFKQTKMQMFEQAVKAKSTVQVVMPRSAASSNRQEGSMNTAGNDAASRLAELRQQMGQQRAGGNVDPTTAYQQRLAQIRGDANGGSGSGGAMALLAAAKSGGGGYGQFDNQSGGDRWELDSVTQAPRTPFEIRAGFVLPATLISGINSSLSGQIIAQVSQNIYDTATGKYLLVPQGSRLVGSYGSDVAYGQSRVLVGWQRIIFPDGKALDIGSMSGADGAGFAGFTDKTNNHYLRIFGSAFLMSGITAGVALSQDRGNMGNGDSQRASDAMSEALGQQLGQVTAAMIQKNLNIAPTLEIRPGYRFNVVVTKDMAFTKPYESFDY